SCLCGDLSEVLPITLSATNGIVQKFHRLAQTTAESDVYGFEAKYNFHEKIYECAKSSRSHAQGALYIATKRNVSQANTFHHLQCDWSVEVSSKFYIAIDVRLWDSDKSSKRVKNQLAQYTPCEDLKIITLQIPLGRVLASGCCVGFGRCRLRFCLGVSSEVLLEFFLDAFCLTVSACGGSSSTGLLQ
ncbi:hypothetical protein BV898_19823, partial [Hypsibius exemplaris]